MRTLPDLIVPLLVLVGSALASESIPTSKGNLRKLADDGPMKGLTAADIPYVVFCQDDIQGMMVAGKPRGGSPQRMNTLPEHEVSKPPYISQC